MLTLPKRNIDVVKEYMRLAYSPKENKGRITVEHLCQDDAYFIAPTTFPGCESPQDYAESHSKIMAAVSDLKIDSYDVIFANGGHVCLRYTASGSHCGEPHNGIKATGKKATWHAAAIFEVDNGKITGWTKEWDKLHMWKQLGWMKGDEYA
jgi:predicted ester cyclase